MAHPTTWAGLVQRTWSGLGLARASWACCWLPGPQRLEALREPMRGERARSRNPWLALPRSRLYRGAGTRQLVLGEKAPQGRPATSMVGPRGRGGRIQVAARRIWHEAGHSYREAGWGLLNVKKLMKA